VEQQAGEGVRDSLSSPALFIAKKKEKKEDTHASSIVLQVMERKSRGCLFLVLNDWVPAGHAQNY